MTLKRKTKFIVSGIAISVALIHLIFPGINIDIVIVILLTIAIIPWLDPLFKSIELPWGVSLEYRDLQEIENKAIKAGLINSATDELTHESAVEGSEYEFVEMAEKNQHISLVILRIEIEKKLRHIVAKLNIDTKKYSAFPLLDILLSKNILSIAEANVLKDMLTILNRSVQGVENDARISNWVVENGPAIMESLDKKLDN